MNIYAFHLLNDYSGSPKVLMQLTKGWTQSGYHVNVVTCSGRDGFLSDLPGVKYHYFQYRFVQNPLIRLFWLCWSQLSMVVTMWSQIRRGDIVYINTVLPFGAAFLARMKRCRLIYHLHETSVKPAIFKRFLFGIARMWADDVVLVSGSLQQTEPFPRQQTHVLYNALDAGFAHRAKAFKRPQQQSGHVLMVCSLKVYKGINEFIVLAQTCPQWQFRLILNATQAEIDHWLSTTPQPDNVQVLPTQTDLHPHYQWADVLLNLSRPDGWIETFGLTILEGMAYGLPAIVPPVGGPTELVTNGINGYCINSYDISQVRARLSDLLTQPDLYQQMRQAAYERVQQFDEQLFWQSSLKILQ